MLVTYLKCIKKLDGLVDIFFTLIEISTLCRVGGMILALIYRQKFSCMWGKGQKGKKFLQRFLEGERNADSIEWYLFSFQATLISA